MTYSFIKSLMEDAAAAGHPDLLADMAKEQAPEIHELKGKLIAASGKVSSNIEKVASVQFRERVNDFTNKIKILLTKSIPPAPPQPWESLTLILNDVSSINSLLKLLTNAYYMVAPSNKLGEKYFAEYPNKNDAESKANQILTILKFSYKLNLDDIEAPLNKLLTAALLSTPTK